MGSSAATRNGPIRGTAISPVASPLSPIAAVTGIPARKVPPHTIAPAMAKGRFVSRRSSGVAGRAAAGTPRSWQREASQMASPGHSASLVQLRSAQLPA